MRFTTENARDHTHSHRKKSKAQTRPERRFRIRVPILAFSTDGKVVLQDMLAAENTGLNACTTLPFTENDATETYSVEQLASVFVCSRMFKRVNGGARVQGDFSPLGYYKTFASDSQNPTDMLSLPVFANLWSTSDELKPQRDFRFFHGGLLWSEPEAAEELLARQAGVLTENKLALESLALMRITLAEVGAFSGSRS